MIRKAADTMPQRLTCRVKGHPITIIRHKPTGDAVGWLYSFQYAWPGRANGCSQVAIALVGDTLMRNAMSLVHRDEMNPGLYQLTDVIPVRRHQ